MIDVQVERPVTIKANGKVVKLTNEEARELAQKLCSALGMSLYPSYPSYPWTIYTNADPTDTRWYTTTDNTYTVGTDTTIEIS